MPTNETPRKQSDIMDAEKKAVLYARYSCEKQTEQSIEGQIRVIRDFAEREGYTIIGEYIDRAKSAKTANRPQFLKMISDSAKGLFGTVIEVGKKPSLLAKFESLELQISEYQEELNSAELAARHIPTRKEVLEWFAKLGGADPMQESVRRQVINTFIQKVFLWDNKAVIVFSLANTEETVAFEEIRDFESLIDDGSCSIVLVLSLQKRFFIFILQKAFSQHFYYNTL